MNSSFLFFVLMVTATSTYGQSENKALVDSLMAEELTEETYKLLLNSTQFVPNKDRYPIGKKLLSFAVKNDFPAQHIAFCYRIMAEGKTRTEADSFLYYNHLATLSFEEKAANEPIWPILTYQRAEFYNGTEQYDSMLYYIDKTLSYEVIKKHIVIVSAAMQLKSNLYEKRNQFDSAQIVLIEALNLISEYKTNSYTLDRVKGAILLKLGKIYRKSKNLSKHRSNLRKGLDLLKDSTSKVIVYGNLSSSYRESAQYDSAHLYALKAADFANNIEALNIAYKRLTETNTALGRYQTAARMKDSLDKYNALASGFYTKKLPPKHEGALLIGLGKVTEGQQKIRSLFRNDSAYASSWRAVSYLDYIKAVLPHQNQQITLTQLDTLKRLVYVGSQDSTARVIEDIRVRYETDKIKSDNELLLLKAQAADTAATSRQRQLWLLLALLTVVGSGLFFALRESRRRKVLNKELAQKNARISLLNSDINHRTNGYLGNIIKLLKEQRFKLDDAGANPHVLDELERQTLVYTKLQNLLTTVDDRTVVNLKGYLKELTVLLLKSFQGGGTPLLLDLKAADINIDPKLALPLALILNELMTNTAKYAARSGDVAPARFRAELIGPQILMLNYEDDGPDTEADTSAHFSSNTGLDLITGLTHQMEADRVEVEGFGYQARVEL